ncbi:hypothetical protein M378DRAFT_18689 [Amanita muscaria Koide BX008]|uniref:Uncharacterized protein n=1 Tax=Amanita muscaria (strain Koide BX008) TaxID=946122 RepID=A0A0C2W0M2_AMAMK|nr:hypothetical protein M378DRAFT_18689 [Amanita muscaria Koide BX008]
MFIASAGPGIPSVGCGYTRDLHYDEDQVLENVKWNMTMSHKDDTLLDSDVTNTQVTSYNTMPSFHNPIPSLTHLHDSCNFCILT